MSFKEKIVAAAVRNQTRTVLALDLEDPDPSRLLEKSMEVLRSAKDLICAVKINRQLILTLGVRTVADSILKLASDFSLPSIMDAKVNDVGHTNGFIARTYYDAGFDAIIASPVAGWENGLDSVFEAAATRRKVFQWWNFSARLHILDDLIYVIALSNNDLGYSKTSQISRHAQFSAFQLR